MPNLARQSRTPYLDALWRYATSRPVRMNVPGHKGGHGASPLLVSLLGAPGLQADVPPLLWGVDRGREPTPMAESLLLAAEAWGARRTWFLTNGASQGNHVACLALRTLGTGVVVQRSMHSSVIDGLVLSGLEPAFVMPSVDDALGVAHGVTPAAVQMALAAHRGAVGVMVVSPSYFGAVADVQGIAEVAHAAGAALVVDEAWGAHFGFHPDLPTSALASGADLVISSTHKMGGSLTQAAMLHLGHGPLAASLEEPACRALCMVQSTSASSLLYASLDAARQRLATSGDQLLGDVLVAAGRLRAAIDDTRRFRTGDLRLRGFPDVIAIDPLRVVVDVRSGGADGHTVARLLRKRFGVDLEVSTRGAMVAVLGATEEDRADIGALVEALRQLDETGLPPAAGALPPLPPLPAPSVTPREASLAACEVVALAEAEGRISAGAVAAYPPGIPTVAPGELIAAEHVAFLRATVAAGGHVRGAATADGAQLRVLR